MAFLIGSTTVVDNSSYFFSTGSAAINTTTPGTGTYNLNFTGQGTADFAQAITWGWSTSGAQAGIYVQSSGSYGTKMYFATTDSFAAGSKTALTIDHSGIVTTNRNYLQAAGSLRAPIFYDSDNTGYYIDPASTSVLNAIALGGQTSAPQGMIWGNGNIWMTGGTRLIAYSTDSSTDSTPNIGLEGAGNDFNVNNWSGSAYNTNLTVYGAGRYTQAAGSLRAPIFYDSDNTAYYTDPASTSVLNGVRAAGGFGTESVGSTSPNSVARVQFPGGGAFSSDGSTGAIKIRLPFRNNNSMWALKVRIYNYSTNTIGEYHIGAYSYNNGGYNAAASYQGSASYSARTVRIGNDGTYDCIYIGETNSSWSYPVVSVTDVMGGYRSGTFSQFGSGWDISIATSFGTIETTITPSITTTNLTSDSALYTPILYDSNNTGYYCDPASTSRLSTIYCGDVYNDLGGWFRNYGATGIYNQSYDNHFYSENSTYWTSATDNGMIFRNAYGGTVQGYVYFAGGSFGLLSSGGNWAVRNTTSLTEIYNRLDAPIMYDSNNTGYYCDPNSESYLYRVRVGPYAGSVSTGNATGLEIRNNGGTGDGDVAAISFHAAGYYGMHMHLRADGYFGIGGWSASAWRWYVYMPSGAMIAVGSVQTPIYYDSDNTGFYADFNSTGIAANLAGRVVSRNTLGTINNGGSKTLAVGESYMVTSGGQTITLPASPTAGDTVSITVGNFTNTVVGRNGQNIMGLAEDMTIDSAYAGITLRFHDATNGWRLV